MKNKWYFSIPIFHLLLIFYSSIFLITQTNDSKDYYLIAENLPYIKNSLFPVFYPFLLKVINLFTNNYFISSKILNIICIFFSLFFSKKYFNEWKTFWIFTLTWGFIPILTYSWSEIIIIPLLLLFFLNLKKFLTTNFITSKKFIIKNVSILFFLSITKYSLISLILGSILFSVIIFFFTNNKKVISILFSSLVGLFLSALYLLLNYYLTGYLSGDRDALGKISINLRLSIYNTLQTFNPFFGNFFNRTPYIIVIILFLLFSYFYLKRIKLLFKQNKLENLFLIFLSLFYLFFLWTTYFITKIDTINIRLLFPFYFLFFIGIYMNSIEIKFFNFIQFFIIIVFVINIFLSTLHLNNYF